MAKVREARSGEERAVAALAAELFPLACPAGMAQEDVRAYIEGNLTPAHFAEYLTDKDACVLVAEGEDWLVGYALAFFGGLGAPRPDFGVTLDPVAMLSKCYVSEALHGRGISQALVERVKDVARARGCAGLWLNVNYENFRAQRFYEKAGWVRVGYVDFVVGRRVFRDPVYQLSL